MEQKVPGLRVKVEKRQLGDPISVEVVGVYHTWDGKRIAKFKFTPKEDTGVEIEAISVSDKLGSKPGSIGFLTWDDWGKLSSFLSASRYPEMWQTNKPSTSR